MRHCDIPLKNSFKTKFLILVTEINCTSIQVYLFIFKTAFFFNPQPSEVPSRYLPTESPINSFA